MFRDVAAARVHSKGQNLGTTTQSGDLPDKGELSEAKREFLRHTILKTVTILSSKPEAVKSFIEEVMIRDGNYKLLHQNRGKVEARNTFHIKNLIAAIYLRNGISTNDGADLFEDTFWSGVKLNTDKMKTWLIEFAGFEKSDAEDMVSGLNIKYANGNVIFDLDKGSLGTVFNNDTSYGNITIPLKKLRNYSEPPSLSRSSDDMKSAAKAKTPPVPKSQQTPDSSSDEMKSAAQEKTPPVPKSQKTNDSRIDDMKSAAKAKTKPLANSRKTLDSIITDDDL